MKRVLVTGTTSGIGKEIAKEVVRRGDHLLMVCRSMIRAKQTKEELLLLDSNAKIDLFFADLAEMKEIEMVSKEIKSRFSELDILINNAGLYLDRRCLSSEGYEKTFAVNHLSYMALTLFVLPLLQAAPTARIVNVASRAHRYGSLKLDDLMWTRPYRPQIVYGTSKLCNILFTHSLSKRLIESRISVNSLHPGVVNTRFAKGQGGLMGWGMSLLRSFFLTPEEGARTPLFLAYHPSVEGESGGYYANSTLVRASRAARDERLAEELWKKSEMLIHQAVE